MYFIYFVHCLPPAFTALYLVLFYHIQALLSNKSAPVDATMSTGAETIWFTNHLSFQKQLCRHVHVRKYAPLQPHVSERAFRFHQDMF